MPRVNLFAFRLLFFRRPDNNLAGVQGAGIKVYRLEKAIQVERQAAIGGLLGVMG